MSVGSAGLPPPTTMGQTNSWHSSTSPALRACAARFAPPTMRSLLAAAFSSCTAVGSKWRSSWVDSEHVVVRHGKVEGAAFVLDVAVKRHVRHVDQLGHRPPLHTER